ncbi:MAG: amidase, partial [Nitrospinaceae bacterium]|nr:amidase [Nitrospinaceae bacterium]
RGMSPEDAYSLCSMGVDLHVTQIVNGYKGIHAMVPKSLFD